MYRANRKNACTLAGRIFFSLQRNINGLIKHNSSITSSWSALTNLHELCDGLQCLSKEWTSRHLIEPPKIKECECLFCKNILMSSMTGGAYVPAVLSRSSSYLTKTTYSLGGSTARSSIGCSESTDKHVTNTALHFVSTNGHTALGNA